MKTLLITLLLTGLVGNTLLAGLDRPAKRTVANARKAATGQPLPPARAIRLPRN